MEPMRPDVAEIVPVLARVVVELTAVVESVALVRGLPVQFAESLVIDDPLETQTAASGVVLESRRLPLEKTLVLPTRAAAKTLAAATVGTSAYQRAPTPKAAKERRGWRAKDRRVRDLSRSGCRTEGDQVSIASEWWVERTAWH